VSDPAAPGPTGHSDQEKSTVRDLPGLAAFAAMGTTIASCIAVGVVLGLYADHLWHSGPAGLLIGIVLGTLAAVASVVKLVRRFL
jgi:F0F1-type ATP synthase assembly protein I